MNLTTEREALYNTLVDLFPTIPVHKHTPKRLTPPCVVLAEGSPWVYSGDETLPWGTKLVKFKIQLLSQKVEGDNSQSITKLEEMLQNLLDGVDLSEVSEPFIYDLGQAQFLAATAITETQLDLRS